MTVKKKRRQNKNVIRSSVKGVGSAFTDEPVWILDSKLKPDVKEMYDEQK